MGRLARLAATLAFWAAAAAIGGCVAAAAANPPQVRIVYGAPSASNAEVVAAHDLLAKNQVLEELQQFLRPLRLPVDMTIKADECGLESRPYDPAAKTATVCYETIAKIMQIVAAHPEISADERRVIVVGTIVEAVFHETAYALFDLYHVPIWGRIEDAADRLAALIMLQFGEDSARTTIMGASKFFELSFRTWTGRDFAAATSPEAQRYYNFLCIAYGGDPIVFDDLRGGALPDYRAGQCAGEYQEIRKAFDLRVMPYIDPDLLIRARARAW